MSTPSTPSNSPPADHLRSPGSASNLIISAGAITLIIVHLIWPQLSVDTITLGLAIIALLPWLTTLIQSAELPGGWKFVLKQVEKDVEKQRKDIDYLKFLFANFLTDWEISHIRKLASDQPFPFTPSESFYQELRRLRALGFIESINGETGIRSLNADLRRDVKYHFRIADRGQIYLKMRDNLAVLTQENG